MEKSGPGASKFQPGQRVVAAGWAAGTWQDYIVQPEKSLVGRLQTGPYLRLQCSTLQRQRGSFTQQPLCDHAATDRMSICRVCALWAVDPPALTDEDSTACC